MQKLPELFEGRMRRLLKEEYDEFLSCFDKSYAGGIRLNTLKAEPDVFIKKSPFSLERIPFIRKGFYYSDEDKPSKHPYYYAGLYYIQEPSAMTPASLLPVIPGDKVLDLCAAPGGKSTELGAKLCGKGVLIANDISSSRAKALLKNIEMFGIKNAAVVSEAPAKLAKAYEGWFDKILVDAPCSGEGMFRKSPAIMKNWEQYGVEYYNKLQKEILPHAVSMLKPGGYLLYSTCTFSPEEDEETVLWLLNQYPELKLVPALKREAGVDYNGFTKGRPEWIEEGRVKETADSIGIEGNINGSIKDNIESIHHCIRLWPHKIGGEGHFIALFKKDDEIYTESNIFNIKNMPNYQEAVRDSSYKKRSINAISDEAYDFLKRIRLPVDFDNILIKEDRLYMVPEGIEKLKGLRVLRTGLLLGEQKKGRFEPSQALACAMKIEDYDNVYNLGLSDKDVIHYLKCESIELKEKVNPGWVLVCVDGYPLGWGKAAAGGTLKNKYLPGWRMMS